MNSLRPIALAALVLAASSAVAQTPAPTARIQAFYDVLLDCMKNAATLKVKGRYDKLAPIVPVTFDVDAMAAAAIGRAFAKFPADKQSAIREAFGKLITASYANRFRGYTGESFTVDPKATTRGADTQVDSKIIPKTGAPVVIDYLMRDKGVEDVLLDGTVSQIAQFRLRFGDAAAGGPDALLAALSGETNKLLAE